MHFSHGFGGFNAAVLFESLSDCYIAARDAWSLLSSRLGYAPLMIMAQLLELKIYQDVSIFTWVLSHDQSFLIGCMG